MRKETRPGSTALTSCTGIATRLKLIVPLHMPCTAISCPFVAGNFGGAGRRDAEAPKLEEIGDPLRIVEKIGQTAVAVPHFAVGKVDPGRGGAEVMDAKGVRSWSHGNEIKAIDTLHELM